MLSKDYGLLSRLLHRMALDSTIVAETCFDLEQSRLRADLESIDQRPVFVSGLARAGTTVLMQTLHSSGEFRSLTYRDMPFVLMPCIWKNLSAGFNKEMQAKERAHGDSLLVDFDTPEAFEEIFWRIFCGDRYITEQVLQRHDPGEPECRKFRQFVTAVVASADSEEQSRYLSKNNNNLLRLAAIRRAFPEATIIVPFREPVQHALSLLNQHRSFQASQAADKFAVSYMNWLGHHEFGLNHKPFSFGPSDLPLNALDTGAAEYWLTQWVNAYQYVLDNAPEGTILLAYEDLVSDPDSTLIGLWSLAGLDNAPAGGHDIRHIRQHEAPDIEESILERAALVHDQLLGKRSVGE